MGVLEKYEGTMTDLSADPSTQRRLDDPEWDDEQTSLEDSEEEGG